MVFSNELADTHSNSSSHHTPVNRERKAANLWQVTTSSCEMFGIFLLNHMVTSSQHFSVCLSSAACICIQYTAQKKQIVIILSYNDYFNAYNLFITHGNKLVMVYFTWRAT